MKTTNNAIEPTFLMFQKLWYDGDGTNLNFLSDSEEE